MSWPLASHFSAALQTPEIAFRDPELRQCRIEKDERNQPKPWAGAFAVVYKGIAADGRAFALRVFTTESPERRERYDRISEYLGARKLSCLVDFEYRDHSIRSAGDGKWYPLILMDWVQGDTLFKWVRARALEKNRNALVEAAHRWEALVRELAEAQISHGDLQHANVMVNTLGELKLVDYDCLCVPSLVGRRNLEVGVEPYQHPERNEYTPLSLDLDNFSALVIYVALRAIAAEPLLWIRYVEEPAHDKLLFRRDDFLAPAASPLYRDLKNSPEMDVRHLAEQLFDAAHARIEQVPRLHHVACSFATIEHLLATEQWAAAVQQLNRRRKFRDAPDHLKPLIQKAYKVVCREQAWAAFQAIGPVIDEPHDRQRVHAWNEALFAGFEPAEACREAMMEARKRLEIVERIARLIQRPGHPPTIRQEWDIFCASRQLPRRYPHTWRRRVREARRSVVAIREMERAVRILDDDVQIVAAWERIQKYRCEALLNPERQPRIELALKRFPCIQALQALSPEMAPDQLDARLLELWQEDLLAGCRNVKTWRPRYELALKRRGLLQRLEEAVNEHREAVIAELVSDPLLADYPLPDRWMPVVRDFHEQVQRAETLLSTLREGDRQAFVAEFDARLIRHDAERFRPHEALLCQWIRSEILPREQIGLRPALDRVNLACAAKRKRLFRACWTWPSPRFADECLLGICSQEPQVEDDPLELELSCRVPVDRASWENAGGCWTLPVQRQWMSSWVVVWAMVDIGFRLFFSHPLILGRPGEAPGMPHGLWTRAVGWARRGRGPSFA